MTKKQTLQKIYFRFVICQNKFTVQENEQKVKGCEYFMKPLYFKGKSSCT